MSTSNKQLRLMFFYRSKLQVIQVLYQSTTFQFRTQLDVYLHWSNQQLAFYGSVDKSRYTK